MTAEATTSLVSIDINLVVALVAAIVLLPMSVIRVGWRFNEAAESTTSESLAQGMALLIATLMLGLNIAIVVALSHKF